MKKIITYIAFLVSLLGPLVYAGPAYAANGPSVNKTFVQELSKGACEGKIGAQKINVTQHVINDVDSGVAGNWAIDNYDRTIQVWELDGPYSLKFCVVVTYKGTANAVAGQTGPGGTGIIGEGVTAKMSGGYRGVLTGLMFWNTSWPVKGDVGISNYGCTIDGICTNRFNWMDKYFYQTSPTRTFDYEYWGWNYDAGAHGTWLNSSTGNSGNIL